MVAPSMPGLRAQRERHREAFRGKVLAAAREIIASEGAEALSMRKLAQRLECSPMSLYSYFHDKHDLLAALAHQGFDALARRLAVEQVGTPRAALRQLYLSYAELGLAKPDDYRVIFMTPEAQPSRQRKTPDDIDRENAAFAIGLGRVRACIEDGLFTGDAHAIATMLWTTVHGAVAALVNFPDFPFGDRQAYVVRVVDWAIDAMQSTSAAPLA